MPDAAAPFAPWRDDAFLAQESVYSLWNKISWFAGVGPTRLLHACRGDGVRTFSSPTSMNFVRPKKWLTYIVDSAVLPQVLGESVFKFIEHIHTTMEEEVPLEWESESLRICRMCIADGVHLRIHQHQAVNLCPLHDEPLFGTCGSCGAELQNGAGKQQAFCCGACGQSLLSKGEIRFGITAKERAEVAEILDNVVLWLRSHVHCVYRGHVGNTAYGPLSFSEGPFDSRRLLLDALADANPARPSWVARPVRQFVGTSIARVAFRDSSLRRSIRKGGSAFLPPMRGSAALDRTRLAREVTSLQIDRKFATAHFQQALRRVAACFIRRCGDTHRTCLNVPLLLTGVGRLSGNDIDPELFNCCPVAIGFWIWRVRSGDYFSHRVTDPFPSFHGEGLRDLDGISDLLLYALERSHLHACVIAADELTSAYRAMDVNLDSVCWCCEQLRRWMWPEPFQSAEDLERQYLEAGDRSLPFVRVDASHVIGRMGCPGLDPVYRTVRRGHGAMPVYNRRTARIEFRDLKVSVTEFVDDVCKCPQPFGYDWIFFRNTERPWIRLSTFASRRARSLVSDMGIELLNCVDRAIELRSAR